MVIVAGSTTGLGPIYASYLAKLGFTTILLIDSDDDALSK